MPSDGILNCLPDVTEEHLDSGLEVIVQEVSGNPSEVEQRGQFGQRANDRDIVGVDVGRSGARDEDAAHPDAAGALNIVHQAIADHHGF